MFVFVQHCNEFLGHETQEQTKNNNLIFEKWLSSSTTASTLCTSDSRYVDKLPSGIVCCHLLSKTVCVCACMWKKIFFS